jgi:hypothetical protein
METKNTKEVTAKEIVKQICFAIHALHPAKERSPHEFAELVLNYVSCSSIALMLI